jgi:hypothetical protein
MSVKTETIRVRIAPGVRVWQALLVAAALVGSLVLGLILGRAGISSGAGNSFDQRDFASYMCTGHVPNAACLLKVARANP